MDTEEPEVSGASDLERHSREIKSLKKKVATLEKNLRIVSYVAFAALGMGLSKLNWLF